MSRTRTRAGCADWKRQAALALCTFAATAVTAGCGSTDVQYPGLVTAQAKLVQQAADGFGTHYVSGEFEPSDYLTSTWEKYQTVAVADAALGAIPAADLTSQQLSQQPGYRLTAATTLNTAIATHQLPNGDFDNGTASSGSGGVNGTFWGEAEGEAALALSPYVSAAQKTSWVTSMEHYSDYLWSTQLNPATNAAWYPNGNVVLREAVILLETYQLSGNPTYNAEYATARQFLTNPGLLQTRWSAAGWKTGSGATGWYSESTVSSPNQPWPAPTA